MSIETKSIIQKFLGNLDNEQILEACFLFNAIQPEACASKDRQCLYNCLNHLELDNSKLNKLLRDLDFLFCYGDLWDSEDGLLMAVENHYKFEKRLSSTKMSSTVELTLSEDFEVDENDKSPLHVLLILLVRYFKPPKSQQHVEQRCTVRDFAERCGVEVKTEDDVYEKLTAICNAVTGAKDFWNPRVAGNLIKACENLYLPYNIQEMVKRWLSFIEPDCQYPRGTKETRIVFLWSTKDSDVKRQNTNEAINRIAQRLYNLMDALDYKVVHFNSDNSDNRISQKTFNSKIQKELEGKFVERFIFMFIGHGNHYTEEDCKNNEVLKDMENREYVEDDQNAKILIGDIINEFEKNINIPGIPKLFFMFTCRGTKYAKGIEDFPASADIVKTSLLDKTITIPYDCALIQSNCRECVSYTFKEIIFTPEIFCNQLELNYERYDFSLFMSKVAAAVSEFSSEYLDRSKKATIIERYFECPEVSSRLTKKFMF